MMANISWNATNTVCGIEPASGMSIAGCMSSPSRAATSGAALPPIRPCSPKYCDGSPNTPDLSLPNAIEYP